jgi:hypothetical protein
MIFYIVNTETGNITHIVTQTLPSYTKPSSVPTNPPPGVTGLAVGCLICITKASRPFGASPHAAAGGSEALLQCSR